MQENEFILETKLTKFEALNKEQLIQRLEIVEGELSKLVKELYLLRDKEVLTPEQIELLTDEQIASLQEQLYGSKSEKYKNPNKPEEKDIDKPERPIKPRVQKPSERYPNIPVKINKVTMNPPPQCTACGEVMFDSGMTENSQQLTVIPKKYEIIETQRVKYKCSCQGCLQVAPVAPKIKENSIYSNEMVLDVVLSKYCDLIPIERYSAMASREGTINLPPHSLIELTHYFAEFIKNVYLQLRSEVLLSRVLRADETPHRMLEGDDKKSWYLWGFSTDKVCFFECHNTRSGDVASYILEKSQCEILVSDVYSGYNKAIRVANATRRKDKRPLIKNANCNAHARRYFFKYFKLHPSSEDARYYLDKYQEIYKLNELARGKSPPEVLNLRQQMRPFFEEMKSKAIKDINKYPSSNGLSKAHGYLINNYANLTRFLDDAEIPIDNNSQESLLRNPVIGRKTWYGTHSERGAQTAAIIFSLVETCKLNKINPREYFKDLTDALLAGNETFTPSEYSNR